MDLFWVEPGLAVAARPRGGDWLEDDLSRLQRMGVDVLVSMLDRPTRRASLVSPPREPTPNASAWRLVRSPIPDRGVPGLGDVDRAVGEIDRHRTAGRRIAIHCRQGLGRAPLVAAAALVHEGMAPADSNGSVLTRGMIPVSAVVRTWALGKSVPRRPSSGERKPGRPRDYPSAAAARLRHSRRRAPGSDHPTAASILQLAYPSGP
jgi:hypothetical protein